MQHTITGVSPDVKDINGKYGPTKVYKIKVNDFNGGIDYMLSADKSAPTIGEVIDGSVEHNDYGNYFKKSPKPFTPFNPNNTNKKSDTSLSFYVAYAKDLIIPYLETLKWDVSKLSEKDFLLVCSLVAEAAKHLKDSAEVSKTETKSNLDVVVEPTDDWAKEF